MLLKGGAARLTAGDGMKGRERTRAPFAFSLQSYRGITRTSHLAHTPNACPCSLITRSRTREVISCGLRHNATNNSYSLNWCSYLLAVLSRPVYLYIRWEFQESRQ